MTDIILPSGNELLKELLIKYHAELAEATTATEAALSQLKQQLATLERNRVAILAQKSLLDTLEKDLTPKTNEPK